MGSGKSNVGRRLAPKVGRVFRDADDVLAERTGRSVRAWFEEDGEAAFRAAEADVLRALLDAAQPSVVACGGGVVVTGANRERLAQPDVVVVWLRADPAFLASRAGPKPHRPLLTGDPRTTLARLHAERAAWYAEVADVVVDVAPFHGADEESRVNLADAVAERVRGRLSPSARSPGASPGPSPVRAADRSVASGGGT